MQCVANGAVSTAWDTVGKHCANPGHAELVLHETQLLLREAGLSHLQVPGWPLIITNDLSCPPCVANKGRTRLLMRRFQGELHAGMRALLHLGTHNAGAHWQLDMPS